MVGIVTRARSEIAIAIDFLDGTLGRPIFARQALLHEAQSLQRDMKAAIREQQLDQGLEQGVVRLVDLGDRRDGKPCPQVGQRRRPGRRHVVRHHDQRQAAVLGLVPGVENLFLVAPVGLVDQAPPDPLGERPGKKRSAGAPWPGQDRRLDRPHAPVAEVIEGLAVGIGNDEPRFAVTLRPVQWERDLVRALFHSSPLGGWDCGACAGGAALWLGLAAAAAAPGRRRLSTRRHAQHIAVLLDIPAAGGEACAQSERSPR